MKSIRFIIFSIIALNLISSKNLNLSNIFNRRIYRKYFNPNKIIPINLTNESSLEDQKDFEEPYYSHKNNIKKETPKYISFRPIRNIFPIIPKLPKRTKNTGIKGISCHQKLGLKKGSHFMSICVMVGFTSDKQILTAHKWALKNKYINNDNKLNILYDKFVKTISEIFQTNFHNDWKIMKSKAEHFYVVNSKGKEIFNSGGIGYRGYWKKL